MTELRKIIRNKTKKDFNEYVDFIKTYLKEDDKKKAESLEKGRDYILNNWMPCKIRLSKRIKLPGCSAEGPVDHATSGLWMTGGAWLSHHLWDHYLFTGDKRFLSQYYPIMKGAAAFLDDILVRDPNTGHMVICPAVSPENSHPADQGMKNIASGVAMDNQLCAEIFGIVAQAAETLGEDDTLAAHYRERIAQLTPGQIGRWGQLQEWAQDWDSPDDTHRHVSHLYGVYPGASISPLRTPQLFSAARTSLVHRGDPSTGWSMGWKVCLWARMLDGDHAYKLIKEQLTLTDDKFVPYGKVKKKGGTYGNLFDAHPPFQIDGNFGGTAGVTEMLLQSHAGCIDLLPSLPDAWTDGHISGLRARGNFGVDIRWEKGKLAEAILTSDAGETCHVRYADQRLDFPTKKGKRYTLYLRNGKLAKK